MLQVVSSPAQPVKASTGELSEADIYLLAIDNCRSLPYSDWDQRLDPVVEAILTRAAEHLRRRLHAYLIPQDTPRTEQAALSLAKWLARELALTAKHLHDVSLFLRGKGHIRHADTALLASQQASRACDGWVE